jgi:hypothetical protein
MSVSRVKQWVADEELSAADLNAEFNNILNNGTDVAFPATKNIDLGGFAAVNAVAGSTLASLPVIGSLINNSFTYYTTAGTQPTYTITPAPAITAYAAGQEFLLKIHSANSSGAATLNVSGLGAKDIKTLGNDALVSYELQQDAIYRVRYDGTAFRVADIIVEVGTFTPTLTLGSGSVTYTTQVGSYVRTGNLVWFQGTIVVNVATTPGGTAKLLLPFAVKNVASTAPALHVQTLATTAGTYGSVLEGTINTTEALLRNLSGNPSAYGDMGGSIASGCTIKYGGCYETRSALI